jgi:hypothetical protein
VNHLPPTRCRSFGGRPSGDSLKRPTPPGLPPNIVLNHPNPATALGRGRTDISFTAWARTPGSVYPNAELWMDSRHVDGRLETEEDNPFALDRARWIGVARLLPGQHVMVSADRCGAEWARLDSNQGPTDYESAALTS